MSRRGATNRRDNTVSQNMFLNIFFVHHKLHSGGEAWIRSSQSRRTIVNFLSVEWTPSRPKRNAYMLRKTMIVLV